MWLDTDSNVPGEVTKQELRRLLIAAKEEDVPIYVVFRDHQRTMLKRKLTHTSHIDDDDNFLWYSDRDGVTKRVGVEARAVIFTNYFHAYAYHQRLIKGLIDA